jgi:hypothetical protein
VRIHFLESAPWNLPEVTPKTLYRRAGPMLILHAIEVSVSLGYKGRVGLFSLPQRERFYREFGMTDLGMKPYYGGQLRYFEITEQQALTRHSGGGTT